MPSFDFEAVSREKKLMQPEAYREEAPINSLCHLQVNITAGC